MSIVEKKREKAHKLLKNNEPVISVLSYDRSMIEALNYYNINHDNKEKKRWFQSHYGKKIKFSLDIPDYNFKIIGTLCRILDNGNNLSDIHLARMDKEFALIEELGKAKKEEKVVQTTSAKPTVSIQEKMDQKVSEFLAEFSGLVDEFTISRTHPKVDNLINTMGIRGPMVKKVLDRVKSSVEELREAVAGTDKQLNEGYSNFKKTELKKLLGIYEQLIASLGQAKVMTVRKERVVKQKPPVQIVKNLKFNAEDKELGLKSVNPATIVGASDVWLFNTKTRKLISYEAIQGQTITVKGTTLLNFDTEKSTMKTIRKPETVAKLNGMGKRAFDKFFKEAKATETKCNGRVNADCIILATFK